MAHIVYDGRAYPLTDDQVDQTRTAVVDAMRRGDTVEIVITHDDGDASYLYVGRGIPVAINSWDSPLL